MAREQDNGEMPSASTEAAEYVLGLMSKEERQNFAVRLRDDVALRAEVIAWENRLSPMAEDLEPVAPPTKILASLEQRLFADAPARAPSLWQNLGFWRGLSLASLAAAVVLGGLLFADVQQRGTAGSTLIAELSGESKAVRLAVAYDATAGQLKVNRVEGAAVAGRVFELWLIEGSNAPVSLGVLPQNAQGTILVPEALRAKLPHAVLAISDEPTGGSPTGAPTGAVLATGQVLTVS